MLYQRGGKTWWFQIKFKGRRFQKSTRTTNKRLAEQLEAGFRTQLLRGEVGIEPEPEEEDTLEEFQERFMAHIEVECAQKPQTVSFYRSKLGFILKDKKLARARLAEIDERMIDGYKQRRSQAEARGRGKPLSPASVNRELAVLRRALRLAQEWKVIDRVPRIRLLRGEHGREFIFSRAQEALWFEAADQYPDLKCVAAVLLDTGLRIAEALSLTWADVHFEPTGEARNGYLTVRRENAKNSRERHVPLTERAALALRSRGPASGLVFHRDGERLSQTVLDHQAEKLRAVLRLPADCVLHSFRHSYGTRLGESGADAFTIMRLMGHSSVTVSQRYVHPTPEAVANAVSRLEAYNRGARPTIRLTAVYGGSGEGEQVQ